MRLAVSAIALAGMILVPAEVFADNHYSETTLKPDGRGEQVGSGCPGRLVKFTLSNTKFRRSPWA